MRLVHNDAGLYLSFFGLGLKGHTSFFRMGYSSIWHACRLCKHSFADMGVKQQGLRTWVNAYASKNGDEPLAPNTD